MAVCSSSSSASKSTLSTQNDQNRNKNKNKNKSKSKTQTESPSHRKKSLGVRLIHGRIYDSKNGKSCHQCRQKTMDFAASCKKQGENKQCTLHFCHKCLLNRYGEKAEEVAALYDWKCPRCRGICNCSLCMKKRGHRPTGVLVYTAKTTGFSSVSELLHLKSAENLDSKKMVRDVNASPKKSSTPNKAPTVGLTRKCGKENGFDGKSDSGLQTKRLKLNSSGKETRNTKLKRLRKNDGNDKSCGGNRDDNALTRKSSSKKCRIYKEVSKKDEKICSQDVDGRSIEMNPDMQVAKKNSLQSIGIEDNETELSNNVDIGNAASKYKPVIKLQKRKKNTVVVQGKVSVVEIVLPQGIELSNIAAIDMPKEDVGHALQFLEFCKAFGQVLDLRKGQPEFLLQELASGRSRRCKQDSSIVRFHIRLLSMIEKDSGKKYPSLRQDRCGNSWLQALNKCISQSLYPLEELLLDSFDVDGDGYNNLDFSKKLRLLNFLCDEALSTADLRSWIDEQNSKFVRREKKANEEVLYAEKNMKKKLQDEVARAILAKNGAPLSISEHEDLVAKIKTEAAQTLTEALEATYMVTNKKHRSDAVRSEPILLDGKGRKFWRLKGYLGEMDILLQDIGGGDMFASKDRWFKYDAEQRVMVEKYISSSRQLRK